MSILIRDCNLFDSVRLETTRGVSILVKDDRVAEIFPGGRNTPPADRVLDAVGCTALPGLFNLHSHPQRRHARFMGPRSPFRVGAAAVESLPNTQRLLYAVQNCWVELIEEGI
ncbi:MAG: hypothetical protein PHX77_05870, partial [Candidatus Bipolaricaulis sp.]|nr:hypothetical protein [Candidatus Bipolaricaulis sp.]